MKEILRFDPLDWYKKVPEYSSWATLFAKEPVSVPVPENWIVYISDVVGSTKAIDDGRYKEVNTAGCLPVMALGNILGSLDFPFVFGGDGITVVLPPEYDLQALATMRDTQRMARSVFGLELRAARIPLSWLFSRGASLAVSSCRVSEFYRQAVFFGDALQRAEDLLKAPPDIGLDGRPVRSPWAIAPLSNEPETADYSGFNCRWEDIPSPQGSTVSIIVKAGLHAKQSGDNHPNQWVFRIAEGISGIIGNEDEVHPIGILQQKLTTFAKAVRSEIPVVTWNAHGLSGALSRLFLSLYARIVMVVAHMGVKWKVSIKQGHLDSATRQEGNRASSDVRKFDGTLKFVAATSPEKAALLKLYLDAEEKAGRIAYGMHISDRALMTCMVHIESRGEVHFVDGADGGYTMAAKMLKDKVKGPWSPVP